MGFPASGSVSAANITAPWTDFAAATTGLSATTVEYSKYIQIGKLVLILYDVAGTSNATTKTLTLPFAVAALNDDVFAVWQFGTDAGTTLNAPGRIDLTQNSTTCTLSKGMSTSGGWTSSGSWEVACQFFYISV